MTNHQNNVYVIITEGQKTLRPNPGISDETEKNLNKLKGSLEEILPANPSVLICGMGNTEKRAAEYLRLTPTNYSPVCGFGLAPGLKLDEQEHILSSGAVVKESTIIFPKVADFLSALDHNSIVIGDNFFLRSTGLEIEVEGGSVILLKINAESTNFLTSTEYSLLSGVEKTVKV